MDILYLYIYIYVYKYTVYIHIHIDTDTSTNTYHAPDLKFISVPLRISAATRGCRRAMTWWPTGAVSVPAWWELSPTCC